MKKIVIGLSACLLTVALVGCTATGGTIGHCLDTKMTDLENTINNITSISSQQLALNTPKNDNNENITPTGLNNFTTPYSNVNTYGFNPFGFYGLGNPYAMNGFYGFNGVNNFNPAFNAMGYGNMYGYNGYNTFNNASNLGFGNWASNVDTYRINTVTEDGKTTTTIDTFHNGEPIDSQTYVSDEDENTENNLQNLNTVYENCVLSNNYGNHLKNEILDKIDQVKSLSKSIKKADIHLNNHQIRGVNELLDNISKTQTKMNMTRGEFNQELNNVEKNKETYKVNPINVNSKYVKLLSCMDTRNSYLQNILNSLLQMENCIDGDCQNGLCWNGICFNPNMSSNPSSTCSNCSNCPDCATCENCDGCGTCSSCNSCNTCNTCNGCDTCTTCTDCLFCTNCENCENCFNCYNCTNCKNLANVSNYKDNVYCPECVNDNTTDATQNNNLNQNDTDTNTNDSQNDNADNSSNKLDTENKIEDVLDNSTEEATLLDNQEVTDGDDQKPEDVIAHIE